MQLAAAVTTPTKARLEMISLAHLKSLGEAVEVFPGRPSAWENNHVNARSGARRQRRLQKRRLERCVQTSRSNRDLRTGELPKLDKAALAALKSGLCNGEDAATWAEAVFHPNVSMRRFARKIFMGLGDEAAPLFARLERFWSEETPLAETSKPREAALRREQREAVSSALELLLRANAEEFLAFSADLNRQRARDFQRQRDCTSSVERTQPKSVGSATQGN